MSKSMKCPNCGHIESNAIDTDPFDTLIRRVRKCKKCGKAWNTVETFEDASHHILPIGITTVYDLKNR